MCVSCEVFYQNEVGDFDFEDNVEHNILCEFSNMIQTCWRQTPSSFGCYVQVDYGVKDSMNIFHEPNTFILVPLQILEHISDWQDLNSKFIICNAVIIERVVFKIAGTSGAPESLVILLRSVTVGVKQAMMLFKRIAVVMGW